MVSGGSGGEMGMVGALEGRKEVGKEREEPSAYCIQSSICLVVCFGLILLPIILVENFIIAMNRNLLKGNLAKRKYIRSLVEYDLCPCSVPHTVPSRFSSGGGSASRCPINKQGNCSALCSEEIEQGVWRSRRAGNLPLGREPLS